MAVEMKLKAYMQEAFQRDREWALGEYKMKESTLNNDYLSILDDQQMGNMEIGIGFRDTGG